MFIMRLLKKYINVTVLFLFITIVAISQEVKLGLPLGHVDTITDLKYSPSGKFIASFSNDNTAKIWDINNGKMVGDLPYIKNSKEYSFVSDSLILLRSNSNSASLYNLKNQKIVLNINHSERTTFSENNYKEISQKLNILKLDASKKMIIGFYENYVVQFNNIYEKTKIEIATEGSSEIIDAKINTSVKVFGILNKKDVLTLYDDSKNIVFKKKFNRLKDFQFIGKDSLAILYNNAIELWDYKNNIKLNSIKIAYKIIDFQNINLCSNIYFINNENSLFELNLKTGSSIKLFDEENISINSIKFEPKLNKLVYITSNAIKVLDVTLKKNIITIPFNKEPKNLTINLESTSFCAFENTKIELYNLENGNVNSVFKNLISPVLFASINPLKQQFYFVSKNLRESTLSLKNGKIININNQITTFLNTPYSYSIYEFLSLNNNSSNIDDTEKLIQLTYNNKTGLFDSNSPLAITRWQQIFGSRLRLSQIRTPQGLTLSNNKRIRVGSNQGRIGFQVLQPNIGWSQFKTIGKHNTIINSLDSFDAIDDTFIISAAEDGSIIYWSLKYGKIMTYYLLDNDPKKWVHLHPSGLFDASPEAMKLMYWTKGLEVIDFSQLKDRYWLPGLWGKVMKGEKLPDVRKMSELKLQPEVDIKKITDNSVTVHLTKRGGGYGKVTLFINGKEAIKDIRPSDMDYFKKEQTITISIKNHPYLLNGENKFTVKASSKDGFVQGRGAITIRSIKKKSLKKPQYFAVIIGVGEYANSQLNLKYTVNDAEAISKAMQLGAENLFGKDRTHIYTITTKTNKLPNKENIKEIFKEISSKANAEDIITVYLSGHGITWGGDQGDFYFLTSDATAASNNAYNDPAIRMNNTISTNEFVDWLKEIPALKQVMIIDACASGKAVDNLIAQRNIEPSQIKAIDRMKDRIGMYIISGSTADAVSYEASKYGQGLLTYSILQAIKGAALKEGKFVDIFTIMDYARETVPILAKGIGGIQEPQLLIPKGGSFDIGMLDNKDKEAIPLANPKTVFVRSTLVNAEEFEDNLGLSELLNNELSIASSKGVNSEIVYFDSAKFPNACKISGGYTISKNYISISLKIRCGKELKTFNLKSQTKEELIKEIIKKVIIEN